ncbi:MAG: hypothetical protein NTZ83_03415 [Candidatus Pacearchaeota archaeon]|nr:hypothetical protein [Candidatus Pacearchaeota archaeon]
MFLKGEYKNTQIGWEQEPDMKDAYPIKIESVRFCEKAFGNDDGLFLELRKRPEDKLYYYGLIGKRIHDMFKADAGVKGFEELVGKYILGNFSEYKSTLQSLMFPK